MTLKRALLFLHVPKTGGTAVREALRQTFGDRLHDDYGDGPADPAAPTNFDPAGYRERALASGYPWLAGKDAVTGHFWAAKYDGVDFGLRATVLRPPIERAFSQHAFWLAMQGREALRDNPVRRYLIEHRLDFMDFARIRSVNHFYVEHLFRDYDMRRFDVIARHDALRTDWHGVLGRIGLASEEIVVKTTIGVDPTYRERAADLFGDASRMARLRALFADDLKFYERWVGR